LANGAGRRSTHLIDDRARIRHMIAAPDYVAVGTHQDERPAIERRDGIVRDRGDTQWDASSVNPLPKRSRVEQCAPKLRSSQACGARVPGRADRGAAASATQIGEES
jgi:hypothetical protein